MGDPKICVVSWTSGKFDILRQYEMMVERGWALGTTQFPTGVHFTITMQHTDPEWVDMFLDDVRDTAHECMKTPKTKAEGEGALYGMAQTIPDRSLVQDITYAFYNKYYC